MTLRPHNAQSVYDTEYEGGIFDIETTCENGFPDIDDPEEQINAITMKVGDKVYCLGLGDFHIDKPNVESLTYTSEEDFSTFLISSIE